ncbi:MAG: glutamine amidotransferase [Planctomycetota bacterium]
MFSRFCLSVALAFIVFCDAAHGGDELTWTEIPHSCWQGAIDVEVPSLKRTATAVVALPAKDASGLAVASALVCPAGLYEVRLTLCSSHTSDVIAFHSGVRGMVGGIVAAEFPGQFFARPHEPETRTFKAVQRKDGPFAIRLEAFADAKVAEQAWTQTLLKKGGPSHEISLGGGDDLAEDLEIDIVLSPSSAVYYLVDRIEYRLLSRSGRVTAVSADKIRYLPGDSLKGTASLIDVCGNGGNGSLNFFLEHGVRDRTKAGSLPVTLGPHSQEIAFEIPLPQEELGYAVVAEYVSADGADHSEAAEYFNIAANFQRVAIFGAAIGSRDAVLDEATVRTRVERARADYFNATEYFAWAEDDLVEMSPATDFWSSGQTNYRMHKPTMQRQIRIAHEQGLAVATYGKFVMSGLSGWNRAYDYPADHRGQYFYPVGMWEGVSVPDFDRRRQGDFRVYGGGPNVAGHPFNTWWASFLPINPDPSPANVRTAAEECVRSIDMFGWDAIRWDGHPRGGGQCGSSGIYDPSAARKTQSLVRYFKDVVSEKHPNFRHGYNFLMIEPEKNHDWAVEDYELDELCRGGGLLMNESIGNASGGWTFAQIVRNLQVDGDLCRERGGFYLGISFAATPRDTMIESGLWAAAGCRPYNTAMSREVRRYCTRFSQYTFDERLRRIATPEKLLVPQTDTRLCWQPFVYETPLQGGRRQLVVNVFNLPLAAKRPPRNGGAKPEWDMSSGTPPVAFDLTLPSGYKPIGAHLIQPQSLEVSSLPLKGCRLNFPAVAAWSVAVIDLEVSADAPSLVSQCGPQKTFGVPRQGLDEAHRREEIVIDPRVEVWEVNKNLSFASASAVEHDSKRDSIESLPVPVRDKALLSLRQTPEALCNDWWKGASLPQDLALKGRPPAIGELTPVRDGRFDIHYSRGAMDDRLRMPLAFAGLGRFHVHDARLAGGVRQGANIWLDGSVSWREYPQFDVLLFTGIPHAAIGAENAYGLVGYVKAGGAAFFTGGEYAFGKGGYMHTVLERELLPVVCTEMQDTAYANPPGTIGPGPDFNELNVRVDFAAKPVYWVRNRIVLKQGAKVFLESNGHPILVGWQAGKGRVACLLVDHRGKSTPEVTAFFDWKDWPHLASGVLRWLAPDAGKVNSLPVATQRTPVDDNLDDDLATDLESPNDAGIPVPLGEASQRERNRDRVGDIASHAGADRVAEGRKRLAAFVAIEQKSLVDFARSCGEDVAMLTTSPCLDSEAMLERMAWLAYLARHDKTQSAAFLREWLRTDLYCDFCGRSAHNAVDEKKHTGAVAAARYADWKSLAQRFAALRDTTRLQAESTLKGQPADAAAAIKQVQFAPEIRAAIDLLGSCERAGLLPVLESVVDAPNPELAAFAAIRLQPISTDE